MDLDDAQRERRALAPALPLTGFVKGRRRPANYGSPPGNYLNLFIPALPVLHYLLWQYGFRVRRVGRANRKFRSWILFGLLYPFLWIWTMRYAQPMKKYDSPLQREACRDLRRILLTPAVMMDENLVLVLEKSGPVAAYSPARAASASRDAATTLEKSDQEVSKRVSTLATRSDGS